ncbi:Transcriptional regulatory protein FixJ [Burkholderiales bacterium]|nr:MAG: response regulator transcription factor [Burkholderiales bacterium]CAG1011011.1 Transcriptional regulatory protein FixJ [Burkholderiales bacterium]
MSEGTVFIIDDDASVRDSLGLLLGLRGYRSAVFAEAESFLQAYRPEWRGCVLLDIRMPGMNGLELQKRLLAIGCELPIIIMTGHGDVESARDAFKARAVDFLEKPLDQARMMAAIGEALARCDFAPLDTDRREAFARLLTTLTPREREVMEMIVAGAHNREIAEKLGISPRTVEVHKARVMQKLQASGVAQLVRLSLGAQSGGQGSFA